ncbi:hypothetical protein L873DRAFT_1800537 [Choiromyces venosus 120613-1]|uniref:Uncharacterized protein n=1 Tax=Choiromyces venosus 120613-1 TaxID=1336337 RepID=A0A3N4JYK2_9PEZI|nr:hypothetical protein L873DRAFT_1800537 [Choiromyces venosus 120613-1]
MQERFLWGAARLTELELIKTSFWRVIGINTRITTLMLAFWMAGINLTYLQA